MMGYAGHNANANAHGSLRQPGAAASTSFRIIRRAWRGVVLHCVGGVVGHGAWCGVVWQGVAWRGGTWGVVWRGVARWDVGRGAATPTSFSGPCLAHFIIIILQLCATSHAPCNMR